MGRSAWTVGLALLVMVAAGCERSETVSSERRVEYRRELQDKLASLEAEMDTLAAKGREAGAEARDEWNEQMSNLRAQRDSLRDRIDRIQDTGRGAWEDVKSGTDRMLERLERSVGDARENLRSREDTVTTRSP